MVTLWSDFLALPDVQFCIKHWPFILGFTTWLLLVAYVTGKRR
jgi:hypothetical protein